MIKIATWNLSNSVPGSPRSVRQLQCMEQQDPDIWILTEAHESLRPGPNYCLASQSNPASENSTGHRWVSVWVRGAVVKCLVTSDSERTACALVKVADGVEVLIYGAVLPWLGSSWNEYPAKDGEAFLASLAAQESDIKTLAARHPAPLVCYGGDFNQDLNHNHYYGSIATRAALSAALTNLGLHCHTCKGNDPVLTRTTNKHANIDHICLSPRLVCNASAWPENHGMLRGLSDHFGVAVTFQA